MAEKVKKETVAKETPIAGKEMPKEVKAETKADKKESKETKKTDAKEKKVVVRKFIPLVVKKKPVKSKEIKEVQAQIAKHKKDHPVFRGRFGKRQFRRISRAKWDKWRKPHGIDLDKGLNHGRRPKTGYKNAAIIRGAHPSGYQESMVFNVHDLEKINAKTTAGRIGATVGKRKRNDIITKANEKGIWILN